MKLYFRVFAIFIIFLMPLSSHAQEQTKDKAPASTRAQRKIAKEKWKQQRKDDRAQKKMVKDHHKRLQTKQTRRSWLYREK